jgi:hypothetical protein
VPSDIFAVFGTLMTTLGMLLLGMAVTWLVTLVVSRLISKRGFALWAWNRFDAIGRVLIVVGFAIAAFGLWLGPGTASSSLILLGALILMGGIAIITFGP